MRRYTVADCVSGSLRQPAKWIALLLCSAACAGRTPAQPAGILTVGVTTTGPGVSAMAFTVEVSGTRADPDARSDRLRADGGIATFRDLAGASYVVRLSLPSQCEADGGASRPVTVAARRTSAVRFTVRCR